MNASVRLLILLLRGCNGMRCRLCIWVFSLASLLLSGCAMSRFCPIPPIDRNGDYFYLTKKYPKTEFRLLGASITGYSGPITLGSVASAVFIGLPLYAGEKFVVCPVLDILWVPEDFFRNCYLQSESSITNNGYWVQLVDVRGKPVKGVRVDCGPAYRGSVIMGKPPVLKGQREVIHCYGYTDENGELYIPLDHTACAGLGAKALAVSDQGELESVVYEHSKYKNSNFFFPKRERAVRLVLDSVGGTFIPNEGLELRESSRSNYFYPNVKSINDL